MAAAPCEAGVAIPLLADTAAPSAESPILPSDATALCYDPQAQVDAIFGKTAAQTSDLSPDSSSGSAAPDGEHGLANAAVSNDPTSEVELHDLLSLAPDPNEIEASSPAGYLGPAATGQLAQQLTQTLHAANAPPDATSASLLEAIALGTVFEEPSSQSSVPSANDSPAATSEGLSLVKSFSAAFAAGSLPLGDTLQTVLKDLDKSSQAIESFNTIHDLIFEKVLGHTLPLVGTGLKDFMGSDDDLLKNVSDALNTALQNLSAIPDGEEVTVDGLREEFFNALGPSGLDVLGAIADATGLQIQLIDEDQDGDADALIFLNLELHGTLLNATASPGFDLGLSGLGFRLTGNVNVALTYDLRLRLGVDSVGFYLDTSPAGNAPEVQLTLEVTIPGVALTGSLAFLQISAADDPQNPTRFGASFLLNITDPDNKLRPADLANLRWDATVSGGADVNLTLTASFGESAVFPSLRTNFHLGWDFGLVR